MVLGSLQDQINWLEIVVMVGKNRASLVYYNAIEKILLLYIYQLVKAEGVDDTIAKFKNVNKDKQYVHVDNKY